MLTVLDTNVKGFDGRHSPFLANNVKANQGISSTWGQRRNLRHMLVPLFAQLPEAAVKTLPQMVCN